MGEIIYYGLHTHQFCIRLMLCCGKIKCKSSYLFIFYLLDVTNLFDTLTPTYVYHTPNSKSHIPITMNTPPETKTKNKKQNKKKPCNKQPHSRCSGAVVVGIITTICFHVYITQTTLFSFLQEKTRSVGWGIEHIRRELRTVQKANQELKTKTTGILASLHHMKYLSKLNH